MNQLSDLITDIENACGEDPHPSVRAKEVRTATRLTQKGQSLFKLRGV